MFDKIKGKMMDQDTTLAPAPTRSSAPAPASNRAPPSYETQAVASESITSISSGLTVVGKISGEGTVKIFGRVEGEISATSVFVCADAQVEGNIHAQDLTIGGRIKGTMQAQRVKLLGTAQVEGDIFHQSLVVEENARFEGSSRRKENMADKPATAPAKSATASPSHAADNAPAKVAQPQQPTPGPVHLVSDSQVRTAQIPPAQAL